MNMRRTIAVVAFSNATTSPLSFIGSIIASHHITSGQWNVNAGFQVVACRDAFSIEEQEYNPSLCLVGMTHNTFYSSSFIRRHTSHFFSLYYTFTHTQHHCYYHYYTTTTIGSRLRMEEIRPILRRSRPGPG